MKVDSKIHCHRTMHCNDKLNHSEFISQLKQGIPNIVLCKSFPLNLTIIVWFSSFNRRGEFFQLSVPQFPLNGSLEMVCNVLTDVTECFQVKGRHSITHLCSHPLTNIKKSINAAFLLGQLSLPGLFKFHL